MKIRVTNTKCFIEEFPPSPWDRALLKEFTKKAKDAFWQQRRNGGWDGTTHFISPKKGMFSTGILPLVLEWAKREEIEVELTDERITPTNAPVSHAVMGKYELRDYQMGAVEAAIRDHRGIIKLPTGSGKTLVAASLIKSFDVDTLFIVERINLATQTRDKFVKEYGLPKNDVGIVGGKFNESGRKVVISTIQSAHKLTNLSRFKCLFLDEMHHAKAKSYIKLFKELDECYYRFGMSGTPFSEDPVEDMYRMTQFGPMIYELKTKELVDAGVLAKPTIRMIEILKPNVDWVSPYLEQYKVAIAQNRYRNYIIAKFARGMQGKTLILFKLIEHGTILREKLPEAMYIDGDTEPMLRDKMLKAFNKNVEGVMLASTVVDEGIDFACINHLIIAGGEKSPIKGIQRLGRGLRATGEGEQVNVIDFLDRTCDVLQRHSKKRMKLYQSEGHTVKVFQLKDESEDQ